MNAELKERYRSLTQAAAIDISDGGPAAPLSKLSEHACSAAPSALLLSENSSRKTIMSCCCVQVMHCHTLQSCRCLHVNGCPPCLVGTEEDEEVEEAVAPPTSDAQPAAGNRAQEAACDIPAEQAAAGRKLKLKVTPQAGASRLLRIGAHEPLSKLFAAFQQHAVSACSMPADAQPSFWFDGEKLSGEATAEGLELEDDFVIDCKW